MKRIVPVLILSLFIFSCNDGGGVGTPITGGNPTTPPPITGGSGNTATIKGAVKGAFSTLGNQKPQFSSDSIRFAATGTAPIADADLLCYDLETTSRTAAGQGKTDAHGNFSISVDVGSDGKGNFICFAVWLDPVSKKVKTANISDIAVNAGQIFDLVEKKREMTVVEDTLSPEMIGIHGDNTADGSFLDGDPDPEFNPMGIQIGSKIGILFSEAVEPATLQNGGIVIHNAKINPVTRKCKKGMLHASSSLLDVDFNGTLKEFRYLPNPSLTSGESYLLEVKRKVMIDGADRLLKDIAGLPIEDNGDKDEVAATACFKTVIAEDFKVISTKPVNDAKAVLTGTAISITFNAFPDFATFTNNITSLPPLPDGHLEANGNTITYRMADRLRLTPETTYTITFGSGIANLAGKVLGTDRVLTFTTAKKNTTLTGGDPEKVDIVTRTEAIFSAYQSGDYNLFLSNLSPNFFEPTDYNYDGKVDGQDTQITLDEMKADFEKGRQKSEIGIYEIERINVKNNEGTQEVSVQHFRNRAAFINGTDISLYRGWAQAVPVIEGIDFVSKTVSVTAPDGLAYSEWLTYKIDKTVTHISACVESRKVTTTIEVWDGYYGVDNDKDGQIDEDWVDYFGPEANTYGIDNDGDGQTDEDGYSKRVDITVCVIDGDGDPTNSWTTDNAPHPQDNDGVPDNDPLTWEEHDKIFAPVDIFLVPTHDPNAPWHSSDGTLHFAALKGPLGEPHVYFDDSNGACSSSCPPNAWDPNADGDWNPVTNDPAIQIIKVPNIPHDLNGDTKIDDQDFIYAGWNAWQYGITFDLLIIDPNVYLGHPDSHKTIDTEPSRLLMQGDDNNDGQINEDGRLADFINGTGINTTGPCANYNIAHKDAAGDPDFAAIAAALAAGCDFSDGIDNDYNGKVDERVPLDNDYDGKIDEDLPGDADGKGCTDLNKPGIDPQDDDCDGHINEDGIDFEEDWIQDYDQSQKLLLTTTDAVVVIFKVVMEESISFDNGVTVGTTGNLHRIKQSELAGPTFANAKVTFHTKETWTPYNPDCNFGGGEGPVPSVAPAAGICPKVETYNYPLFFDYEKINGDWFVLSVGEPERPAYTAYPVPVGIAPPVAIDVPIYMPPPPIYIEPILIGTPLPIQSIRR